MEGSRPAPASAPAPPGGVYLCRVGERLSCGACCGLYNRTGVSRPALEETLRRRTARFRGVPRTAEAIDAYAREEERREPGRPRFSEVYRCPFLGFTGTGGGTPGCLLHPESEGNGGVDYRGLSFYGGLACRDYFCPAHRTLKAPWKRILRAAAGDWYAYGILVTEHRLLGLFFAAGESRLGRALEEADEESARPAFRAFADLVLAWPWRGPDHPGPGRDPFDDGSRPRADDESGSGGFSGSPFAPFFRELGSHFASPGDLAAAERCLDGALSRLAAALSP